MKAVAFAILFLTIFGMNYFTTSENVWYVEWYKLSKTTYDFEEIIGYENWTAGNFEYNWHHDYVYDNMRDRVGFIATTKIYSDGGRYKFELYNVDDEATLFLDDEKIIHTIGRKSVEINISKGVHTLKIEWQEHCCGASIGFSTDEELFVKKNFNDYFIIELIIAIIALFSVTFFAFFVVRKKLIK